jgi:hypothetical protein
VTVTTDSRRGGADVAGDEDRPAAGVDATQYRPPMIEALGSLRKLTKGGGPGGMPIVLQSGIPGG